MSDKNIEVENFGLLTSSAESMVVLAGASAFQDDFVMLPDLNDDQIIRLKHIVSDPKHPWMVEHSKRCKDLEKEILQEALRKKTKPKEHLKKLIKTKRWKNLSLIQKIKILLFQTAMVILAILLFGITIWVVLSS